MAVAYVAFNAGNLLSLLTQRRLHAIKTTVLLDSFAYFGITAAALMVTGEFKLSTPMLVLVAAGTFEMMIWVSFYEYENKHASTY